MQAYLLSQLFGAVSFALGAYGYWYGDRVFKICFCLSSLVMAVHYALLNAPAGVIACVVAAWRYYVCSNSSSTTWMTFFMLLNFAATAQVYQTPADALPILASILSCYTTFNLQGTSFRVVMLAVSACWIAYNAIHLSIVGAGQEVFYSSLNLITLYRTFRVPAKQGA